MPKEKNVFYGGDFVYNTFHQGHEVFCLKFVIASKIGVCLIVAAATLDSAVVSQSA